MNQFQEKAKITKVEKITADTIRTTFTSPKISPIIRAGQFVMVKVSEACDPLLRRPFSVHQVVDENSLQILFKVVGKGTALLAELDEGDEVSLLGPLGKGFRISVEQPACLVGGGLGIAPLLLLAKEIHAKSSPSLVHHIILGGRSEGDVKRLSEDFAPYRMQVHCITDDGTFGAKGFVTDVLKDLDLAPQTVVYTCGPEPMMKGVAEICRSRKIACQVSVESVMACGMGACLGCTKHDSGGGYVHVCLDGPVFMAEDLKWE